MPMHIKRNGNLFHLTIKTFDKNNAAALNKHLKSLIPNQKAQELEKNAVEQKNHCKSLSSEQKAQIRSINAVAHKKQYELLPPEKKQDSWKPRLNNVMNI